MTSATTYTVKVQGTQLFMTRGMDDPLLIGAIQNFNGLSTPVNKINIGSWEDTKVKTRPGRKKIGDASYDIFFNPDDAVQQALKEMEGTDEEAVFQLVQPEGTKKTRTFTAMVGQFGDDAKDDSVLMGHIVLAVTTNAVRS